MGREKRPGNRQLRTQCRPRMPTHSLPSGLHRLIRPSQDPGAATGRVLPMQPALLQPNCTAHVGAPTVVVVVRAPARAIMPPPISRRASLRVAPLGQRSRGAELPAGGGRALAA